MHHILLEIADPVGMVGVVLLLIAYFFLSIGRWISHSFIYQFYNLLGAILILYSLCFHFNLSSFVIEVAWVIISLIGIYRVIRKPLN
jgi:multisubunit Na+/H+ antiporter MnhB subunit